MTIRVTTREIIDIGGLLFGCLFYDSCGEVKPESGRPPWGLTLPTADERQGTLINFLQLSMSPPVNVRQFVWVQEAAWASARPKWLFALPDWKDFPGARPC